MTSKVQGWQRIRNATGYSCQGIRQAYRHETAFRQEVWLMIAAIPLSFIVAASIPQWLILIGSLIGVLICELVNSAIESVVDRVGAERHPLSGQAKDMGSAAVLLSLIFAALCWGGVILMRW
ncbi:diacylglycerol kinase [Pokkaliibacter sp. CJK22405]|uniref:diacylglycerol kinase n=1 Tax=Pokkaliibacter sp. CJK22405 TaxID=3384615 RepID=UPI0039847E25